MRIVEGVWVRGGSAPGGIRKKKVEGKMVVYKENSRAGDLEDGDILH